MISHQKRLFDLGIIVTKTTAAINIINKVQNGIKEPVDSIIKDVKVLYEIELEHDKQQEYLNNIIDSCNQLMDLTKVISDDGTEL